MGDEFNYDSKQYKKKPNVIYMKGPKDRLLMMTEQVDQTFENLPKDPTGVYGGKFASNPEDPSVHE